MHVFVRFPEPKQIGRRLRPLCSARAKLSNTLRVGKRAVEHQTYVNGARFVDFLEMFLIILLGSRWLRALQLTTGSRSSVVVFASLLISGEKKIINKQRSKTITFAKNNFGQETNFSTVFFGRVGGYPHFIPVTVVHDPHTCSRIWSTVESCAKRILFGRATRAQIKSGFFTRRLSAETTTYIYDVSTIGVFIPFCFVTADRIPSRMSRNSIFSSQR